MSRCHVENHAPIACVTEVEASQLALGEELSLPREFCQEAETVARDEVSLGPVTEEWKVVRTVRNGRENSHIKVEFFWPCEWEQDIG